MTLPVKAIMARVDVPTIVEIKPGQKTVRLVIRTTLHNTSGEPIVLHSPSRDHEHFWHVFDENGVEIDRERGTGKGGEKASDKPLKFRSLTLTPDHECHETRTIRIDASSLLAGSSRCLLRGEIWGQSAEAEFHTVVRPAKLTPAKKRAPKRSAPKKKPVKKKAAKKTAVKETVAKKRK